MVDTNQKTQDELGFSGLGTNIESTKDTFTAKPQSNIESGKTNTYSNAYSNREEANLETDAPKLDSMVGRNVNKKAIALLLGLGTLALIGTVWAFNTFFGDSKPTKEVAKEEVVKIPDAPVSTNITPSGVPMSSNGATPSNAETEPPIPVVNNTPPPVPVMTQPAPVTATVPIQSAPAIDPYVEQRKQAGTIVNAVSASSAPNNTDGESDRASATLIRNAENLLVRGTYIRCILETKIVTDVPGFASCIVTEPVYSMNGKKLLISKGSKISGRYQQTEVDGPRLAVVWERIVTPNGYDVRIQSPGVDNLGGAGHVGDYKSHWPSRIASALLISLISDTFKYAAAQYGPQSTTTTSTATTQSPYDSSTAKTIETAANNALARAARRPATVTINQGSLLNIYTSCKSHSKIEPDDGVK